MTQTEKLSRILFVSNVLYILSFFTVAIEPDLLFSRGTGMNFFGGILYILAIFSFAHWIYCLWFLNKFDRYSGNLIWLIIFNGMYAPFYYYQVIIKKRPLKNEILSKHEFEERERKYEIEESDYAKLMVSLRPPTYWILQAAAITLMAKNEDDIINIYATLSRV